MDVFLMIRRNKTTIFTDAKENTSVTELKRMIGGILKVNPSDQILFYYGTDPMANEKLLQDYGITMTIAKAQAPVQLGLVLRSESGEFEQLDITSYSSPPDLPEVMKTQDTSNGQDQVA
ncbi:elongin-B [Eupeodes corollae]|uniref:elongin-B n=1 Tax=Eupeodes corollae TaxID=290404 RepID=UPI00248FDDC6|nr:elongin-B [Eupeodes corollae]